MKEANLRSWHRQLGIILAVFIIVQVATGIVISIGQLTSDSDREHKEQAAGNTTALPVQKETHDHAMAASPGVIKHPNVGHADNIIMTIHHGGGSIAAIYRVLLGTGLLIQAFMGIFIFFKIRSRTKNVAARSYVPRTEGS